MNRLKPRRVGEAMNKPLHCIAMLAAAAAGCTKNDPVADAANDTGNVAAAVVAANNVAEAATAASPAAQAANAAAQLPPPSVATGTIPAALQGRWGMNPADCTSRRGDSKGLMIVSPDMLQFYESQARPAANAKATATSFSGDFAFSGEGQKWTRFESLEVREGKLVRTESSPMASYTYARCT